ncbi:MAG: hypothetical protein KAW93_07210, partial [Methanogenium sp.]|nr:hypothetical protein [Methanogenium sp.]
EFESRLRLEEIGGQEPLSFDTFPEDVYDGLQMKDPFLKRTTGKEPSCTPDAFLIHGVYVKI